MKKRLKGTAITVNPILGVRRLSPLGEKIRKAPLSAVKNLISQIHLSMTVDTMEQELLGNCLILKNMAIVRKDHPIATDRILEELIQNSKALNATYEEILIKWRKSGEANAFDLLYNRVPTKAGRNFALIISKTEQINPAELVRAMKAFQEAFSGDRVTRAMKRREKRSVLMTVVATASIFAVLMNFAVMVFTDMMSMVGQIF